MTTLISATAISAYPARDDPHAVCDCECHDDECDRHCAARYRNEGYCIRCDKRAEERRECPCGCADAVCWGCNAKEQALSQCGLCQQCERDERCSPDYDD